MFFKKPRHRVFDYPPRFYKSEEDKNEKLKRKLGFRRQLNSGKKKRSPFIWVVIVALVIFIYLKLSGIV